MRRVHRRAQGQAGAGHDHPARHQARCRREGHLGRRRHPRPEQRQDLQGAAEAGRRRQEARRARLHRHADARAARRPGIAWNELKECERESIQCPQGRRARRRRDGRADRRPSGQLQGAGGAVRPAGQGRPEVRHRHQGDRGPEEAQARAAGRARGRGADPARQLRGAPGAAGRLRPGDRGHRRAHGLEARPVQEDRAARGAACHPGEQHLGPVDHEVERSHPRRDARALLRHPLLQPAALHGAGRADPDAEHQARGAGPAGGLRHQRAWARTWCAPRTRPTSSPTASASPACWRRCSRPRRRA